MLLIRGLLGSLAQVILFAALLFIPAGTWQWPRAIVFLSTHGLLLVASTLWLARVAPASLEARMQPPVAKSQPPADRIVSAILFVLLFAWIGFIPTDVFHLRLLPPPGIAVSIIGAVLYLAGYGIVLAAAYQNAFAAPIVMDQSDRGQVLVDTGLYGHVRHPLYLGFLLFLAGIGLWLESYAGVLLMPIVFAVLAARIFVEEKMLRETLAGYAGYMGRVRYRIVPFVW